MSSGTQQQQQSLLTFQRQYELQADALAVKMMAACGYDPAELARFVETSVKDDGSAAFARAQQARLDALRYAVATSPAVGASDGAEFARVHAAVAR